MKELSKETELVIKYMEKSRKYIYNPITLSEKYLIEDVIDALKNINKAKT